MLHVFVNDGDTLRWAKGAETGGEPLPESTVWIDLLNPTPDEVARAEALVGRRLPTREQMAEIEESSRLRLLPGALHATILALVWADTDTPSLTPVGFVLTPGRLVTLHQIDPQAFLAVRRRAAHRGIPGGTAASVLVALVDGTLERTAAILRRTVGDLDAPGDGVHGDDTGAALKRAGRAGHLFAKTHESLASMVRMLDTLSRGDAPVGKKARRWARGALMDARGLDEYAQFLSGTVKLRLDTTLGRIGAQQNEIVKIVSVLSATLFPPTLVASIYGMNFTDMAGEASPWGYPLALATMLLSAGASLWFFRWKRWL